METKIKLKLLKRHNRMNPGDVIEVRPREARILKAIGTAEDYVASARRAVANQAMQTSQPNPTTTAPVDSEQAETSETTETTETSKMSETSESESSGSETTSGGFGSRYGRRDMRPEE